MLRKQFIFSSLALGNKISIDNSSLVITNLLKKDNFNTVSFDDEVQFLEDVFVRISNTYKDIKFTTGKKSNLDSEPILICCNKIILTDLLDSIRSLYSFKRGMCFWESEIVENATVITLNRNENSKKLSLYLPGEICSELYNWIEEVCQNINESEAKQKEISRTNPLMADLNSDYMRSQYVIFSKMLSETQRKSLLFGENNLVKIPFSEIDIDKNSFIQTQLKRRPDLSDAASLNFRSGSWDQYNIIPIMQAGISNSNTEIGISFGCSPKCDKVILQKIRDGWMLDGDLAVNEKEVQIINSEYVKKKLFDKNAEIIRNFSLVTGIPVIARLPNVQGKLQDFTPTYSVDKFLRSLDQSGFMYKWRNGILIICLKNWFNYDNENYKVPYSAAVYIRDVRKKSGHLRLKDLLYLVNNYSDRQIEGLRIGNITELYPILKEVNASDFLKKSVFSDEGLFFKDMNEKLKSSVYHLLNVSRSEMKTLQAIKLEYLIEDSIENKAFLESKIVVYVLHHGKREFSRNEAYSFDRWKK
jgi:hypothetical protein